MRNRKDLCVVTVNGDLERSIRQLKRQIENSDVLTHLKRRSIYPNPSDREKFKRRKSLMRFRIRQRKAALREAMDER